MSYQNRRSEPRGRAERDFRPAPWRNLRRIPTLWADYTTGQGVMGNGQAVKPKIGPRRKNPNLQDMLDTAADAGADRIMFTGNVPAADRGQRHWLLVQTPGWKSMGHWLGTPVTGRFERIATGQQVEVRTAKEWFGNTSLNPEQARQSWDAVESVIAAFFPDGKMMKTPAATGTNLWALSLPKNVNPVPVSQDIAEELHRTSGQHHIEHLVAGESMSHHPDCRPLMDPKATPRIPGFAYVDGRFMYAALCRELGIGPGERLNRQGTHDLLNSDPYARARVYVRFTVPDTWDHLGIFGVQHPEMREGWYYPNRPGATGETWADTAEIQIAQRHGWLIEPMESVVFTKKVPSIDGTRMVGARPLDTWAERLTKARAAVAEDPEMPTAIKTAVTAALRAILLQAVGAFASRGRGQTFIEYDPRLVPSDVQVTRQGKAFVWQRPAALNDALRKYYRPELAMQVWARGRARLLEGPMADGVLGGALAVDPSTLIGVMGDAIYTTGVPQWSLPQERGGADDGRAGRMRLQGYIEGPLKIPETAAQRNALREKAARLGPDAAFDALEFQTPDDTAEYLLDPQAQGGDVPAGGE